MYLQAKYLEFWNMHCFLKRGNGHQKTDTWFPPKKTSHMTHAGLAQPEFQFLLKEHSKDQYSPLFYYKINFATAWYLKEAN